jgi:hypothetical protein
VQLGRDVAVGGGNRELVVLVRAGERDQDLALHGRQVAERQPLARDLRGLRVLGGGPAVGDRRLPDADHVAVAQAVAPADALPVDVGAVARKAVVADRPLARDVLELGVQARDLRVPGQRHAVARAASHADAIAVAVELDDLLLAVVAAEDQERPPAALRLDPLAQLDRRRAVGLKG